MSAPKDLHNRRPIFSSYTVVLLCVALYLLMPAILIFAAGEYTWASRYYSDGVFANTVWLSAFGLVAFVYGNLLFRNRRLVKASGDFVVEARADDNVRPINGLLLTLLGLGIVLKIALIIYSGGMTEAVLRLSGFAREFSGVATLDSGAIQLRTISGIADGAATWGVIQAIRGRHRQRLWFAILFLTLGLTYIMIGKRLVFLLPLLCLAVAVHAYRRPLTTKLLPVVFAVAVGIGFLSLITRIFLPASVAGYGINLNNVGYAEGSVFQFYLYSLEFSSVEMISVAMLSRAEILSLFGGAWDALITTNIEPFFYSVPRAIWPGKPTFFYDLSYGISAALGDSSFDAPTVGYASTLIGTAYLLGGVIGVGLAMFGLGALTARIDTQLMRRWSGASVILYALALVVVFNLFRQGTVGWTFIVTIVQQYGALAALLILSLASRRKKSPVSKDGTVNQRDSTSYFDQREQ
ncbi:hypothetical protein [Mycobacterium sp. C31M]